MVYYSFDNFSVGMVINIKPHTRGPDKSGEGVGFIRLGADDANHWHDVGG